MAPLINDPQNVDAALIANIVYADLTAAEIQRLPPEIGNDDAYNARLRNRIREAIIEDNHDTPDGRQNLSALVSFL